MKHRECGPISTFAFNGEAWLRVGHWQFGWHPRGRWRGFSERVLHRRGIPTIRVGRSAEISMGRLRG